MESPIYDIKVNLFSFVMTKDYLIIVAFVVFIILFYYIVEYFFSKSLALTNSEIKAKKDIKNNIKTKKQYLLDNIEKLDRLEFYSGAWSIIRDRLFDKYSDKNIYNMTFKELSNNFDEDLVSIYKDIYYMEFNNSLEDNLDKRKDIITKL